MNWPTVSYMINLFREQNERHNHFVDLYVVGDNVAAASFYWLIGLMDVNTTLSQWYFKSIEHMTRQTRLWTGSAPRLRNYCSGCTGGLCEVLMEKRASSGTKCSIIRWVLKYFKHVAMDVSTTLSIACALDKKISNLWQILPWHASQDQVGQTVKDETETLYKLLIKTLIKMSFLLSRMLWTETALLLYPHLRAERLSSSPVQNNYTILQI